MIPKQRVPQVMLFYGTCNDINHTICWPVLISFIFKQRPQRNSLEFVYSLYPLDKIRNLNSG